EILRQYMAKADSPTHGRELNVHFNDLEKGYLGQISHLGDMIPVMAGIALTFKLRREPRVGLVYIGDGGTSTGTFHEGLNFAAVQRLPLVVIGEYNHWAYSTAPDKQFAVNDLGDRVRVEVDHATDSCVNEPLPEAESALPGVYVEPPAADKLWFKAL